MQHQLDTLEDLRNVLNETVTGPELLQDLKIIDLRVPGANTAPSYSLGVYADRLNADCKLYAIFLT